MGSPISRASSSACSKAIPANRLPIGSSLNIVPPGSVYAYDAIEMALGDLSSGGCDVFMKLAPVTEWFVRDRPALKVVQTGITREHLGICVRKGNTCCGMQSAMPSRC